MDLKKLTIAALLPVVLSLTGAEASDAPFQLIVNPSVSGNALPRNVLADVFLKRVLRWGDGQFIDPVDLTATSPVREAFSESVLGMPTAGVRNYWFERISRGLFPPRTKQADADVIGYVASHPGGIGYVAADTPIPPTVKVVKVL